jgi:hypothetical protein
MTHSREWYNIILVWSTGAKWMEERGSHTVTHNNLCSINVYRNGKVYVNGVHILSKRVPCHFAHFNGLDVHLLTN